MTVPDPFDLPDDEEDFLCRAVEEIERNYYEAKRRAAQALTPPQPPSAPPPFRERQCICGRGPCDVVWKWKELERGGWAYVCSAPPKCSHSVWCEESDLHPNSQPSFWSHPEPKNNCELNTISNHRAGATARVNVTPQSAGATTPVNVIPQGASATSRVNINLQGAIYNSDRPICTCTAGKCNISTVKGVAYYVCPIPKGKGACSHRELVHASAEEPPQTGNSNSRESNHSEYNPVEKEAEGNNLVTIGRWTDNRPVNPDEPRGVELPFDIDDGHGVPTIRSVVSTAAVGPPQTRNSSPRDSENLEDNQVQKEIIGRNLVMLRDNNDNRPVNPDEPQKVELPFDIDDGHGVPTIWSIVSTAAEEPPQTGNSSPRDTENLEDNQVQKEINGRNLVMLRDNNDNTPVNPDEPQKVESDIDDGDAVPTIQSIVNTAAEEPPQTGNSSPREGENLEYNRVHSEANGPSLVMLRDNNDNRPVNPDEPPKVESPFDIVDCDAVPTGRMAPAHPTPVAAVAQGSPAILHQLVVMVKLETPAKSPMPPKYTICGTPRSDSCFQCGEGGRHGNCAKASRFYCGETGRWKRVLSSIRRSISFWLCAKGNKT